MNPLVGDIRASATSRIKKFERQQAKALDENRRRARRALGNPVLVSTQRPPLWSVEPAFDPYRVRSRAPVISHAIQSKIANGSYSPIAPFRFTFSKPGGGQRTVASFAIADEVVSKRTYRHLMSKNRARLSARSYAYRDDLNVHDAIAHLQSEWSGRGRVYVANYDFSDFFGSIEHEHIWKSIDALGLSFTRAERNIFRAFLEAPLPTSTSERSSEAPKRERGVPQGTSLSLLAANIAATPLDRSLERLGVSFARYADDVLIWSSDYSSISRAADEIFTFSDKAGCPINHAKSRGIQILVPTPDHRAEFEKVTSVEFLSHEVGISETRVSLRSMRDLRERCSKFIFDNLLREPLRGSQNLTRLSSGLDRDYVTLVWQLRRYLYGNQSEVQVRRLLSGPIPSAIRLGGVVARFPFATDVVQLNEFDTWLNVQVWLALRRRASLLDSKVLGRPEPWGHDWPELRDFTAVSESTKQKVDARLPSARRMAEVVWRATHAHGRGAVTYAERNY